MDSHDWGNGLPIEIMSNIMDIIVTNLDGQAFTASAQVNQYWNATFKPMNATDMNVEINDATDAKLLSVTKVLKGVRFLTLDNLQTTPYFTFYDISRWFPELVTLHVNCDMELLAEDVSFLSTLSHLQELSLKVRKFKPNDIMTLGEMGLVNFYASNYSNGCIVKVDPSASVFDYAKLTQEHMYEFNPYEVAVFKEFGENFDYLEFRQDMVREDEYFGIW